MMQYNGNYTDENGRPVKGALVYVFTSQGATAQISDSNDNPVPQPLVTDENGNYSYRAPEDYYQHQIWLGKRRVLIENEVIIGASYRDKAQSAASAALAAAGVGEYATTGAGLAATEVGETFWIDQGDGTGLVYRHDVGPVATPLRPFILDPTESGTSALLGHIPSGAGASPTDLAVIFNRLHVWTEDYGSFQEAFDAAVARGAELHFRPGVTYAWPAAKVTVTGKIKVVASGAILEVATAITALEFATTASGSEWDGGLWRYTGPKTLGYNAASNAILVTGTRNGIGVAPTFIQNVRVHNAAFDGFGNTALEWRFAKSCSDENLIVLRCGYAGVYCYSVETYRSTRVFVNTLAGQLDTGNPATSELNAYGFTATALTGGAPDRVRDPHSRDIIVDTPTMINIPTWHAIDTHGADGMIVKSATIIDCRRGVVFTALSDRGASNCKAIKCTATNNLSPAAVNANGSFQKGEAFWDVGASAAFRNSFNRFEGCTSFGHGNPNAGVGGGFANSGDGAVTIGNADDGFYGISDEQSQFIGWKFGANIARATIDARTTNTRHATATPSVGRIEGDNIDLRVARWKTDARNPAIDAHVMVNGLVVVNTNAGGKLSFEDFDLTACTAGELVSTSGNSISADLSGNYSIIADVTMTGVSSTVVVSVRFVRQGRLCSVQLPASGLIGTSNATTLTLTGVPAAFRPPTFLTPCGTMPSLDGGANYVLAYSLISTAGEIIFSPSAAGNTSNWTAAGDKALRGGLLQWLA